MTAPTGTVTFLFTDIESSTRLWEHNPAAMRDAVARHDALIRQAIAAHDGVVFKTMGDAFCAAFWTVPHALNAVLAAQTALQMEPWPEKIALHVRMALHTGMAEERNGDYFGPPLNRVARLLSAGHGGQILLSQTAYDLTRDALPPHCILQDLGAHALRDLGRPEQIYQLLHPDMRRDFPPLKSLHSLPNNLLQQVTSFIGREKELTQIKILLGKNRLLTLTGSGGCGKTRLSLQAAADVLESYPDGVWLVELADITDPALVSQSVASVLGVKEQPGQTLTLTVTDSLKSKNLLLILDNCEHLLSACAAVASDLLRHCPEVCILASSREGLNIAGEQTYRVPSLSLPDLKTPQTPETVSQYEAVRLFIERAVLVKPDFTVTNANAPAVASICHRVDGIPLALELASARVRSLSVEEINDRLDNRFRLLTGGARTSLPRQQTLRALIDWSYDLLTVQEQSLLCRLSVFSGGWTLEAAETVCPGADIEDWEVLDLLTSLVDKSLVQTEEDEGQTRYRLLETVRQYGRDKLAESGATRSARDVHAAYFLTLAETAAPKLKGSEQSTWLSRLETEHDNLRSALAWLSEMPEDPGPRNRLRLVGALYWFWYVRGYVWEGQRQLSEALAAPGTQGRTRERAKALNAAGLFTLMQNDHTQARRRLEESLALSRELEDRSGMSEALNNLGNTAYAQGDYTLARARYEESLVLFREIGNTGGIANVLNNLGLIAHAQGDYGQACAWYEESLTLYRELGNQGGIALSLNNLSNVAHGLGDDVAAQTLLEESLVLRQKLGNMEGIADNLEGMARLSALHGRSARAARLWGAASSLREAIGAPIPVVDQADYDRAVAAIREIMGDEAFVAAWTTGRAQTMEQAVAEALGE